MDPLAYERIEMLLLAELVLLQLALHLRPDSIGIGELRRPDAAPLLPDAVVPTEDVAVEKVERLEKSFAGGALRANQLNRLARNRLEMSRHLVLGLAQITDNHLKHLEKLQDLPRRLQRDRRRTEELLRNPLHLR
jgi:hypothetical protein